MITDKLSFWLGSDAADVWREHLVKQDEDAARLRAMPEMVDE